MTFWYLSLIHLLKSTHFYEENVTDVSIISSELGVDQSNTIDLKEETKKLGPSSKGNLESQTNTWLQRRVETMLHILCYQPVALPYFAEVVSLSCPTLPTSIKKSLPCY